MPLVFSVFSASSSSSGAVKRSSHGDEDAPQRKRHSSSASSFSTSVGSLSSCLFVATTSPRKQIRDFQQKAKFNLSNAPIFKMQADNFCLYLSKEDYKQFQLPFLEMECFGVNHIRIYDLPNFWRLNCQATVLNLFALFHETAKKFEDPFAIGTVVASTSLPNLPPKFTARPTLVIKGIRQPQRHPNLPFVPIMVVDKLDFEDDNDITQIEKADAGILPYEDIPEKLDLHSESMLLTSPLAAATPDSMVDTSQLSTAHNMPSLASISDESTPDDSPSIVSLDISIHSSEMLSLEDSDASLPTLNLHQGVGSSHLWKSTVDIQLQQYNGIRGKFLCPSCKVLVRSFDEFKRDHYYANAFEERKVVLYEQSKSYLILLLLNVT